MRHHRLRWIQFAIVKDANKRDKRNERNKWEDYIVAQLCAQAKEWQYHLVHESLNRITLYFYITSPFLFIFKSKIDRFGQNCFGETCRANGVKKIEKKNKTKQTNGKDATQTKSNTIILMEMGGACGPTTLFGRRWTPICRRCIQHTLTMAHTYRRTHETKQW